MFTVDEHIAERQTGDEKGVGDVCSGKKRGGRKVTLHVTKTNRICIRVSTLFVLRNINREVLALSFLHREDKRDILSRRADLEAEGVRVEKDKTFHRNLEIETQYFKDI